MGSEAELSDPIFTPVSETLDLRYHLRVLSRYRWPIALFTGMAIVLATLYAFLSTPLYRASAVLLIEPQQTNLISIEQLVGIENENPDYYETQFALLESRALAEQVIDRLGLWNHPDFTPSAPEVAASGDAAEPVSATSSNGGAVGDGAADDGAADDEAADDEAADDGATDDAVTSVRREVADAVLADVDTSAVTASVDGETRAEDSSPERAHNAEKRRRDRTVSAFLRGLTISPVPKTKLVKIQFDATDPVLAADIANAIGEQYITRGLDMRMRLTTKAATWLNERLDTLKQTLDDSEQRLIDFKREEGLIDVDGSVGRLTEKELLITTSELAEARGRLADQAELYREMQAATGSRVRLENLAPVRGDPVVGDLKRDLGQAQRTLDELMNRYGPKHPKVIDARSRVSSLDTELGQQIDRIADSIAGNHRMLQQRVRGIERQIDSGREKIQAIGIKKFQLKALQREVATNQKIFETFFSRMTETKSADGLEVANATVSDYAVPPNGPIKPNKQLVISLAAFASLLLSALLAMLYDRLDDTVRNTHDIERVLGVRLLGVLPKVRRRWFRRATRLPIGPGPDTDPVFVEAINSTRTAMSLSEDDRLRQVILVTSTVPGEGKSTLSINLAYSFAHLQKVLLIDCDMRRPMVGETAELDRDKPGLSSLIAGTATARTCIRKGVYDGYVDVLAAGPIPDQPLELLSSSRFLRILEGLRAEYDRIIIDSAPMQAVSDALVLSSMSDALVYVVKSHDTPMTLVSRGVQRLLQIKAPFTGVVVTQVDPAKVDSGGTDYSYQSRYHHYASIGGEKRGRRVGRLKLTPEQLLRIKTDDRRIEMNLSGDEAAIDPPLDPAIDPAIDPAPSSANGSRRRRSRSAEFLDDIIM